MPTAEPLNSTVTKEASKLATLDSTIRLSCGQLKVGMRVVELDRPWRESPFTIHGFRIDSDEQIRQLKNCCHYVYVAKKPQLPSSPTPPPADQREQYRNTSSFQEALSRCQNTYSEAKSVVTGFLNNLRLGEDFETEVAKQVVKQCVDSVIANQEAMLWLSLLKNVDEYTAQHCLNVGLLSIILGRAEGLPRPQLEHVGLCGILHDMGKSKIPLEILNKEGAFSDDEFEIMKSHTTEGFIILSEKADIDEEVANVAHSHHERLNGKGYPRKLSANKLSYYTRIVAIADAYDAITSKRVYSPAKTSMEGLRILIGARNSHFDPHLVDKFAECMGIYPAGSVAELSSKEVAIVLPGDEEARDRPKVLIVRGSDKRRCPERVVDLSSNPMLADGTPLKIKHLLSDDAFGIDLKQYHQLGSASA